MNMARYLIGIDLGTTNSALAYIDLTRNPRTGALGLKTFEIPQLVDIGVVPTPLKFGVFVRFWISQLALNVCRCSAPNRKDFAIERFQLNWQGPSIAPRCSSPYDPAGGVAGDRAFGIASSS